MTGKQAFTICVMVVAIFLAGYGVRYLQEQSVKSADEKYYQQRLDSAVSSAEFWESRARQDSVGDWALQDSINKEMSKIIP